MGRVLVVGGYGAFGARVAERLAASTRHRGHRRGPLGRQGRGLRRRLSRTAKARGHLGASRCVDGDAPPTFGRLAANGARSMRRDRSKSRTTGSRAPASAPRATTSIWPTPAPSSAASGRLDARGARGQRRRHQRRELGAGAVLRRGAGVRRGVPQPRGDRDRHLARQQLRSRRRDDRLDPEPGRQALPAAPATGAETTAYGWQGLSRHRFPGARRAPHERRRRARSRPAARSISPRCAPRASRPGSRSRRSISGCGRCRGWCAGASCATWARCRGPLLALKRASRFLGSDRGGMFVTHGRARQ